MATTLSVGFVVVLTNNLHSPRKGFLTDQCKIFENIKSKDYSNETTMRTRQHEITEILDQKKTNSYTPVDPTRDTANILESYSMMYCPVNSCETLVLIVYYLCSANFFAAFAATLYLFSLKWVKKLDTLISFTSEHI